MKVKKNVAGMITMLLGLLLLAAALSIVVYNYTESKRAGAEAAAVLKKIEKTVEEYEKPVQIVSAVPEITMESNSTSEQLKEEQEVTVEDISESGITQEFSVDSDENEYYGGEMPVIEVEGYEYIGMIEIPSLEISLPVMSGWDYERLKKTPCRYTGSYFTDDLVICGHNYRSHFALLIHIDLGEEVRFINAEGTVYKYTVVNRETVDGASVEEMITKDDWDLTLFTCNAGGQTRCAVRCLKKS